MRKLRLTASAAFHVYRITPNCDGNRNNVKIKYVRIFKLGSSD